MKENIFPLLSLIIPEDIGLFFFSEWRASKDLSLMSFNMYVADTNIEKVIKNKNVASIRDELNFSESIKGIKIIRFFIHCQGLMIVT